MISVRLQSSKGERTGAGTVGGVTLWDGTVEKQQPMLSIAFGGTETGEGTNKSLAPTLCFIT